MQNRAVQKSPHGTDPGLEVLYGTAAYPCTAVLVQYFGNVGRLTRKGGRGVLDYLRTCVADTGKLGTEMEKELVYWFIRMNDGTWRMDGSYEF